MPRPARASLQTALSGLLVAFGLATAVLAALYVRERQRPPAQPPGRFEIRLPEGYFLQTTRNAVALSPDGALLAFSAQTSNQAGSGLEEPQLFLRPLDSLEVRPIPGTGGGRQLVFSPDGRQVAFSVRDGQEDFLKRVPVAGGPVETICSCDAGFGAAWSPDGSILFGSEEGPLQRVAAAGGTPEPVTTLDKAAGELSHRLPHLLPDGRTVVYTALRWRTVSMTWEKARIYAGRLGDEGRALLVEGGSDGRWAPPGVFLFAREGKLLGAPFDTASLTLTGKPVQVVDGVRHVIRLGASSANTGAAQLDVSSDGLLAWGPGSVTPPYANSLTWVDPSGRETPLEGGPTTGPVLGSQISADGQRVLIFYNYPGMEAEVLDLARGQLRRVTFGANTSHAILGPGPDRITFESDNEGPPALYTRRLDAGPEEIETLWKPPDGAGVEPGSWSWDGKVLAFLRYSETNLHDIWVLERGREPRPFVATKYSEMWPDVSPDGQWLLWASTAPGRDEVFARPLSGPGSTIQVSVGGGSEPRWSRDGTAVYYRQKVEGKPGTRVLVRLRIARKEGALAFGAPERLFEGSYYTAGPMHSWDVGPDGRFLLVKKGDSANEAGRAFWDKLLTNRIVVDTGGVARLMAEATAGR